MNGYYSIKEVVEQFIDFSHKKINQTLGQTLGKSMLAGMMIGLGAAMSSVASHSVTNVGLAKLTAGCVFPVGLMMVILLGAELFTGDCLVIMSVLDRKEKLSSFFKLLCLVFIGNFIGGALTAVMIALSGQWDYSYGMMGAYAIKVALGKVNLTFVQAIVSGTLCNILVSGAVLMAMCAKDVAGKLMAIFFAIMLFITGGFEHCVANMYYITAGMIAAADPKYAELAMEAYGISQEYMNTLNVGNFLITNLVPVTLGNIIGGSLCLGAPLYYINCKK